jgi:hypothetical protein
MSPLDDGGPLVMSTTVPVRPRSAASAQARAMAAARVWWKRAAIVPTSTPPSRSPTSAPTRGRASRGIAYGQLAVAAARLAAEQGSPDA